MYTVTKESSGKFTKVTLRGDDAAVSIIPEFGGNVQGIMLGGQELLDGDKNYKELVANKRFKGAKLLPFPNRIGDGQYWFGDRRYRLPINFPQQHHAIHGLLYNKRMTVSRIAMGERAAVTLTATLKDKEYPSTLRITIIYELSRKGFSCTTSVKNIGKKDAPFADGWHPYFQLGKADSALLKLPKGKRIIVDDRMIPTGELVDDARFATKRRIGKTAFDTGFKLTSKNAVTEFTVGKRTVQVWQRGYPFLQVFIPPSRTSIAIEPMTAAADAFNNSMGLITLKPDQEWTGSYGVR